VTKFIFTIVVAAAFICLALLESQDSSAAQDSLARASDPTMITIGASRIEVTFEAGSLNLSHDKILHWITTSACAVRTYYGEFPVRRLTLIIVPVPARRGVIHGVTFGENGATIRMYLGQLTSEAELHDDWKMTHEMVHLAFPSVAREHHWIEEGIATYVEPIARAETGELAVSSVWRDLVEGLPKGLPGPDDKGLDRTPTWGRTYWGGALFCLLADVEIRRRTNNRHGLEDALRAIVVAGANIEVEWKLARALQVGDQATGVHVLTELYERMGTRPVATDLPALWSQLGVEARAGTVAFDDHASLANVRRAIVAAAPAAAR